MIPLLPTLLVFLASLGFYIGTGFELAVVWLRILLCCIEVVMVGVLL